VDDAQNRDQRPAPERAQNRSSKSDPLERPASTPFEALSQICRFRATSRKAVPERTSSSEQPRTPGATPCRSHRRPHAPEPPTPKSQPTARSAAPEPHCRGHGAQRRSGRSDGVSR